ncbi:MAG TPA: VanZ family protein [Candidatus Deferrimicrobium sp.]|nr:VanZ family protein [Candidatus Deferrimicrobium sp.]
MISASNSVSRTKWFLFYHAPAIAYTGAIIAVSSIPHLKAPDFGFGPFDKLVHFVEYGIFAGLVFRSLSHVTSSMTNVRAVALSALFLTLFALSDELLQSQVPGRDANVFDLAADMLGIFVVLVFLRVRPKAGRKWSSSS